MHRSFLYSLQRRPALRLALLLLTLPTAATAQVVGALEAGDQLGSAVATGDFNGDGFDDLATGAPSEDVGNIEDAGAVNVLYGANGGLAFAGNQLWSQNTAGVDGVPEAFDLFGAALAAGDFDGDGYDDLAIGVPYEDVGTVGNAGAVNVLYGSAGGLTATGNQIWTRDDFQTPGAAPDDRFGATLTSGDYNGDGFGDLVIGAPYEDLGLIEQAGKFYRLTGSSQGLFNEGGFVWAGPLPSPFYRHAFALASGDYNGDGYDDLAVGVVGYDLDGATNAGGVLPYYGGSGGLFSFDAYWTQDTAGIIGVSETGDQFGYSLASADFDGDGYDDLAIGVPFEDVGTTSNAGAANVIYGAAGGLTATGNQLFDQTSAGISAVSEAEDRFGLALAAGRINVGGFADLAVGLYGEGVGSADDAGAVVVIAGSGNGLDATLQSRTWQQGRDGALDRAEAGDRFGAALAIGAFDGTTGHLAVGVPSEDLDGDADAGAVNVLTRALYDGADVAGGFWYQGLSLDVAVTPLDPPAPVTVQRGGRIRFRVTLTRYPGSPDGLDYWADAVFPNGSESGPYLGPGTVQVPCCGTGSAAFRQRVGNDAPLGTYLYVVKIGHYPSEVLASAVFTIQVTASEADAGTDPLATRDAGDGALGWLATDDSGRPLTDGHAVAWVLDEGPGAALDAPTAAVTLRALPSMPALHAAYPNPFAARTAVAFDLAEAGRVRLAVYDALGREVAVLLDGAVEAGRHEAVLDATALPSGVYLVRLEAGGQVQAQRLTRVR